MIGIDTTFLIAAVYNEHPCHEEIDALLGNWLDTDERLGLCSHVVSEFLHVVTDGRRFERPMTMPEAIEQAESWLLANSTIWLSTDNDAVLLAMEWMSQHKLGRKRVLDTMIAATYSSGGVERLATLNPADFRVFNAFELVPTPDA